MKEENMEIARHAFYVFELEESESLISLTWTERTADMTDADFKDALLQFANQVVNHRIRRCLIDVRNFGHTMSDTVDSWRIAEIIPRYRKAGVEKFAFVVPGGADAAAVTKPGEPFLTRFCGSLESARAWLLGTA
jgi:hypothetical protein